MEYLYTSRDHSIARKILFQSCENERISKERKHVTDLCTRSKDIAFATCMPQCKFDDQAKSAVRSQKERAENLKEECLKKMLTSNRRNAVTEMMIVETIGLAGYLEQCFN